MNKQGAFKLLATFMLLTTGIIIMNSCKKDTIYSCDPKLNSWAKANRDSFHDITRKQLALLPMSIQNAIYNTLTPEEKRNLWVEKLNIVMEEWPESISIRVDILTTNLELFNPKTQWKLTDEDEQFIRSWENEMLSGNMDSTDYVVCFYMLATNEELDMLTDNPDKIDYSWFDFPEYFHLGQKEAPGGSHGTNDCNCSNSILCYFYRLGKCVDDLNKCSHTTTGCGMFKLYPCTGQCENWELEQPIVND